MEFPTSATGEMLRLPVMVMLVVAGCAFASGFMVGQINDLRSAEQRTAAKNERIVRRWMHDAHRLERNDPHVKVWCSVIICRVLVEKHEWAPEVSAFVRVGATLFTFECREDGWCSEIPGRRDFDDCNRMGC